MRLVAALALALVTAAGCARRPSAFTVAPGQYADGADGLKALWTNILDAARKDEREHVHDLMATTLMTHEELRQLFGDRADALEPRYQQLMGTLINRGAIELCAQVYDRKYDTVDTFPDENDANVTAALVAPRPLWSVRLRKASDDRGLRYDFFVYLGGRWRTGNQLGKFIDVVK
jgi:hypothetical protein